VQIFSGSSNQDLTKKIVRVGEVELGIVSTTQFENGERRVRVGDGTKNKDVEHAAVLVQSLSSPVDEHLIEFCLLSDALSRYAYTDLIGVIPWLGYSKQDKVFLPGESLAAKVVAQIIQTTKIKKLITFDLHNRAITGFFDIPVIELSAKPIFLDYFRKMVGENTIVVAPDEGAVKSSAYFARELLVPIAYMDKRRDLKTGEVEVVGMSGEVRDRSVIIVDDMIVTGSTMMETAKYLKSKGAKSVSVAATHHLFIAGVQEKLDQSEIDEVVVSDTVQCPKEIKSSKLKILSVASLIAEELR
jgi:ribose-phosphate pyrophosphokinase